LTSANRGRDSRQNPLLNYNIQTIVEKKQAILREKRNGQNHAEHKRRAPKGPGKGGLK